MMVAHDHDVPSTAGPRLQAGRDRLDQIHDRIAHHHPIVFTQVSHVDRPRFVPRPSDQLLNFGCVGHEGSPLLLALILCCHRSSLSSPFPSRRSSWKAELSADRKPVPSRRGRRRSPALSRASTVFYSAKRSRPTARSCSPRRANSVLKASCRSRRAASIAANRAATG